MAGVAERARRIAAPLRRHWRIAWAVAGCAGVLVAAVAAANAYVVLSTRGESTADVADAPHAQVALVLGAFVNDDGTMSAMLSDRVEQAAELWEAGKVDRILVSGDHGRWEYSEPDTMRLALERAGVPRPAVFTDHAGFDTWSSMVRARQVFDVRSAIVVTQGFHMARALYLADRAGLEATGVTSDLQPYGSEQARSEVRELASRVKAVADATLGTDVVLGPPVPITGDARASRGPAPPPGTPPAGAPR